MMPLHKNDELYFAQRDRPKAVFVTGTDTGVGKSIVVGLLARYLLEKGHSVITQKWIQTGALCFSSDIKLHLAIMGRDISKIKESSSLISPYRFKTACSPHLACKIERRKINAKKILRAFKLLSARFDFVIVEGTGGLLVPFNKDGLLVDIAKELHLPVLVVAQNRLGAINHTILTVEALHHRKMRILGVIFNNLQHERKIITDDNPGIIKALTKEAILGVLPWSVSYRRLYAHFMPIARRILRGLFYG